MTRELRNMQYYILQDSSSCLIGPGQFFSTQKVSFPQMLSSLDCLLVLWFLDLAYGFISFHCYHFIIRSHSLVPENKPPSVLSVRTAFIGTRNPPLISFSQHSHHLSSSIVGNYYYIHRAFLGKA